MEDATYSFYENSDVGSIVRKFIFGLYKAAQKIFEDLREEAIKRSDDEIAQEASDQVIDNVRITFDKRKNPSVSEEEYKNYCRGALVQLLLMDAEDKEILETLGGIDKRKTR